MAAGTRWVAGAFLALLAACGGGETPEPAPSERPVEVAPSPFSVPSESGSTESAPAAVQSVSSFPVDEAQAAADLASGESVAVRVSQWLESNDPKQVARALRLLAQARANGAVPERSKPAELPESAEIPDSPETLAALGERARRGALDWAELGFSYGSRLPAEEVLGALQAWGGADPEVSALADRVERAHRADALVQRAQRLRGQGKDDKAVALMRQVLEIDPGNPDARAALELMQRAHLAQAMAAAQSEAFAQADDRLADAVRVLPGSDAAQDAAARIAELRERAIARWRARVSVALEDGDADAAQALLSGLEAVSQDERDLAWAREGIERVRRYGIHAPGQLLADPLADGGSAPGMVVIAAGRFQMGSPRGERDRVAAESPRHAVTFERGFALARTETTVAQFRAFVEATGYRTSAEKKKRSTVYDERNGAMVEKRGVSWRDDYAGQPASDGQPVVHVSWNDAAAYAAWLSEQTQRTYRLPSEAEFEYALRAGGETRYPWGEGEPPAGVDNLTGARDQSAGGRRWSNAFSGYGDGAWGPAPVGSYSVNAFGLGDMNGNVSEWVADCWHESYARAPRDGTAWINPGCKARVVRGASWASSPDQARAAFRLRATAGTTSARVGFRVTRELGEESS